MAIASLDQIQSIIGHYGTPSWSVWAVNDYGYIYSGTGDGVNYRSRLTVSTAGLSIYKSVKLVVGITTDQQSSPSGCTGILVPKNAVTEDIMPNEVQDSAATGPSEELISNAIATSVAYADPEGVTLSGSREPAGTPFYFIFNTDEIEADKEYYIFLIRSNASNNWVRALCSAITATLHINDDPIVHIFLPDGDDLPTAEVVDGSLVINGSGTVHVSEEGSLALTLDKAHASIQNGSLLIELDTVGHKCCVYLFDNEAAPSKYMPYIYNGTEWIRHSDNT